MKGAALKIRGCLVVVSLAWGAVCAGQDAAPTVEAPIARALDALGPDGRLYDEHLTILANPYFAGRAPGTPGGELAAEYIEFQFRDLGLTPLFHEFGTTPDGAQFVSPRSSYRQRVEGLGRLAPPDVHRVTVEAAADGPGETKELTPGADFVTLGYSGPGRARGEVVFVGYSIAEGPDGYTSYPEDEDLTGKIALVLRFEPLDEQGNSQWAAQGWSAAAALAAKIGEALRRGAEGVILVNAPGANDARAERLIDPERSRADSQFRRPVVMMTVAQAEALVSASGEARSLAELRAHADGGGAPVALPGAVVEIVTAGEVSADNVGAMIAGRGALASEWLILGAHYDHLGASGRDARIHPGADDNASGTASLLLAARLLRDAYRQQPADTALRSIAFVAFTAEEMGLLGSAHFVESPPMPREKMHLMFNMDMVGRLRDGALEVEGANTAAGLQEWARPYFESAGMDIALVPQVKPTSDHASFYRAEVPVLCFFTGFHPEYHRPEDVAALINRRGAVQITQLVVDLAMGLAARPEPLEFTRARGERMVIGRARPERDAATLAAADAPEPEAEVADEAPAPTEPEQVIEREGLPVRLGVSGRETEEGVLFEEVEEGSPAQAGGLKSGDRLLRWNRAEVTDLESWWKLLESHTPGDLVTIVVQRDEREVTGYVILGTPE